MSEATRTAALLHACAAHGPIGDHKQILASAEAFHAFIISEVGTGKAPTQGKPATPAVAPAAAAALAAATAAKKAAASAAAKAAAAAKTAEDAAAETGTGDSAELDPTSLEAVEAIIADMLTANARKKAVALLAEYNAKSASGVPEESRAEFIEKAQNILLGA